MQAPRLYATAVFASSAFSIVFALHPFVRPPQFWYYPIEHAWTFAAHGSGIVIGWYGRTLTASLVGLVAALITGGLPTSASLGAPRVATWALVLSVTFATAATLLRDLSPQ